MRVAAVQFDMAWEDKRANHATVEQLLDGAAIEPGDFVLLPEMADTGFSFDLDRIVDDLSTEWASRTAHDRAIWLQMGYAVRGEDGRGRNCATIFDPTGEPRGTYQKVHPFSYGREIEYFGGGNQLVLCDVPINRGTVGPDDSATVCPTICYDLRFAELWRLATRAGAEVFTIGANWPAARQGHWRALLIARAIENQAYVVAVNRTGNDPKIEYAGGSIIVSPRGEVIAEARNETMILTASLDLDDARAWRQEFPARNDIRDGLLGSIDVIRV